MLMTLIVRMMNTQVVLLSDKGIEASEAALTGYCQLHRLLLAVVDKYPQLRALIRKRLEVFARNPESRVKAKTPSLGEVMVYLTVSDSHSWQQLAMPYLLESFDRSVLWACTKDASLAQVSAGEVGRLDKYLVAQRVSLRLTLFHSVFLRLLVGSGGSRARLDDCMDRYDTFQGRPPRHVRCEFHNAIKEVLGFETWPQFFQIAGVRLPSKDQLLAVLEKAVGNSLRKGYHSRTTDFSAVMGSGVSKILLKGETYSAAPNLRHVQLMERWRYDGEVIFLDASCLVFGFHGDLLGRPVDYNHTQWGDCIRHSGDIVYEGEGQHTIDIDIARIPREVKAMFFTVSAWTTTLRAVSQPSCHLHDSDSDTEMCRYKHEGTDTGDKTAVIMCKLHRFSPDSRWELTSIGKVGYGRAGNYTSILEDIRRMS
jgi:stress response protein SCP2